MHRSGRLETRSRLQAGHTLAGWTWPACGLHAVAIICAGVFGTAAIAQETTRAVPFFPTASMRRQGFVRVLNHTAEAGVVRVVAYDDAGTRHGPATLTVGAHEAAHFNSDDLVFGNAAKGLADGIGRGHGDWRQRLTGTLDIDVLAYVRTADGFLTALHDTAPLMDGRLWVPTLNPGSNTNQIGRLHLSNPGVAPVTVSVTGIDDRGESTGPVTLSLPARASRTITSAELESGNAPGLDSGPGDGFGKWQLLIAADGELVAMSLLESPSGHLTNLSSAPEQAPDTAEAQSRPHSVWLFPVSSDPTGRQGFVRVINRSHEPREVEIVAIDDDGRRYGPATLSLGATTTVHFNADDLESGNPDKGLPSGVGSTAATFLRLSSELDLVVLSYVRTADGFVTAMHDTVPPGGTNYRVPFFNPGSNLNQLSRLRLVNAGGDFARLAITGIDDLGRLSRTVRTTIRAGKVTTLSAAELEAGTGVEGPWATATASGSSWWRPTAPSPS